MKNTYLAATIACAIVLGVTGGWLRTLPDLGSEQEEPSIAWSIPSLQDLQRSDATLSVQARSLRWIGNTNSRDGEPRQDWTLKAILAAEGAILIQTGKPATISRAEVGGTLPDGSRLLSLHGDTALIELDGCQQHRHLYPRASNSDSPECQTASLTKEKQQQ